MSHWWGIAVLGGIVLGIFIEWFVRFYTLRAWKKRYDA